MSMVGGSIQRKDSTSSVQKLFEESQDDADDRRKRRNMLTMILSCSFAYFGYGVYGAAYSQWIYVRFEMDALGDNLTDLDHKATTDPCFRGNHTDSPFKAQLLEAQANTAHFSVLTTLVSHVPSFFVNLLLGAYSDQIGRRLIFITCLTGNVIRTAIVAAVAYWELQVNLVLIGQAVFGLTGDYGALAMAIFVYTADNTTKGKNRSFLMVGAQALNLIFVNMSQLASGYFIESAGYVWPMVAGLAGMSLSWLSVLILLPETLDRSRVRSVSLTKGVKDVFSFYFDRPANPLYKRKDFILLGLVFLIYDASLGYSVTIIFLMNEPFCWGATHIGNIRSIFGLAQAVLSTLTMKFMQLFLSDEVVVVVSLLSSFANRCILAFAEEDWHIYAAYGARAFEPSVLAIVRAILSRLVSKRKRGSLFASLAVMETAVVLSAGSGLNQLYSATVDDWRGLMYFVVGLMVLLSALIMIVYKIMIFLRKPPPTTFTLEGPEKDDPSKPAEHVGDNNEEEEIYAMMHTSFSESNDFSIK